MWASMPTRNLMSPSEQRPIDGERALHSAVPRQVFRSPNATPAQIAVEIRVAGSTPQAAGQLVSRVRIESEGSTRGRLLKDGDPAVHDHGTRGQAFAHRESETLDTRRDDDRGRVPHH